MNNFIWSLFLQTGDVETYLLLKKLENEQLDNNEYNSIKHEEDASFQTKM